MYVLLLFLYYFFSLKVKKDFVQINTSHCYMYIVPLFLLLKVLSKEIGMFLYLETTENIWEYCSRYYSKFQENEFFVGFLLVD